MPTISYYLRMCATCEHWDGARKLAARGAGVDVEPRARGLCRVTACEWPTRGTSNTRCRRHERWHRLPAGTPDIEPPIRPPIMRRK